MRIHEATVDIERHFKPVASGLPVALCDMQIGNPQERHTQPKKPSWVVRLQARKVLTNRSDSAR